MKWWKALVATLSVCVQGPSLGPFPVLCLSCPFLACLYQEKLLCSKHKLYAVLHVALPHQLFLLFPPREIRIWIPQLMGYCLDSEWGRCSRMDQTIRTSTLCTSAAEQLPESRRDTPAWRSWCSQSMGKSQDRFWNPLPVSLGTTKLQPGWNYKQITTMPLLAGSWDRCWGSRQICLANSKAKKGAKDGAGS